ncbi:MAG: hypothetical protein EOP45_03845 [Sphingobacteriaceae bacterium]|nr:MAG: hypothetical protein EOP45_03845 [Sphingobacteriaceae bacterium]
MEKIYNTQIYLSKQSALWAFITLLVLSAILIFIAVIFKAGDASVFIGFAFLVIAPFMFLQKLRNLFTRDVIAKFNSQSFSIKEYGSKRGNLINEYNCLWEDIKCYKCSFSSNKYTSITLNLKDGVSKNYLFKDNKTENESIQEESIFSIFYSYVSQYNAGKPFDGKICLSPLFLASSSGAICIILLAILGITAIIFQFLLAGKLAFSSLMSFSIFLQLIIRRENYKKTYKNIMNLDDDIHDINSN